MVSQLVSSPTTAVPRRKARAISLSVPYSPPMAMHTSAELTIKQFRASPRWVTIGRSTCSFASALELPGNTPTTIPRRSAGNSAAAR